MYNLDHGYSIDVAEPLDYLADVRSGAHKYFCSN